MKREILAELVHNSKDLFETVKIIGDSEETRFKAIDVNKSRFFEAILFTPEPELEGEFGITNLSLLEGLLNFPTYKTENAKFKVDRQIKNNVETVTSFNFKDENDKGASFKTMAAHLAGEQANIGAIPWSLVFKPSKAKIAELNQLYRIVSEIDKSLKFFTEDDDLIVSVGDDNSSTHNVNLVFESGVVGQDHANGKNQSLTGELFFNASVFLTILRIAGNNVTTIKINNKNVLLVEVVGTYGTYNFYMRAHQ